MFHKMLISDIYKVRTDRKKTRKIENIYFYKVFRLFLFGIQR